MFILSRLILVPFTGLPKFPGHQNSCAEGGTWYCWWRQVIWPILLQFTGWYQSLPTPQRHWQVPASETEAKPWRCEVVELPRGISVLHWGWNEHTTTSQCSPGTSTSAVLSALQHPPAEDLNHLEGFPATQSWCQTWCVLSQELYIISSSMSWSSRGPGEPFPWRMGLALSPCSL